MELMEAMRKRRSTRQYTNQKVDRELIKELIDAALLAPSWRNSQVCRYYVVQDVEQLSHLKLMLGEFNYNNVKDVSLLIVGTIVANNSGYTNDGNPANEIGNGWGCYDAGMQHMNLLLKANELGLSTLVMGIRDENKIRELLEIPDNEMLLSVISVGYSDLTKDMPKRKTVEDITKWF